MGGEAFKNTGKGASAAQVFCELVDNARYEYGHGGYTGTIAEKDEFVVFDVPEGMTPREFIRAAERQSDGEEDSARTDAQRAAIAKARRIVDDKWGPAAAVQTGEGEWTFFGWASS